MQYNNYLYLAKLNFVKLTETNHIDMKVNSGAGFRAGISAV